MANRRVDGEGTLYRNTSTGRWEGQIIIGYKEVEFEKPDGTIELRRRPRRKKFKAKILKGPDGGQKTETKAELAKRMRDYDEAVKAGEPVKVQHSKTVSDHVRWWLNSAQLTDDANLKTVNGYWDYVRLYIEPGLGSIRLTELRPHHVIDWMDAMAKAGRQPATIKKARTILRRSLRIAVQRDELASNPVDSTDGPRIKRQLAKNTADKTGRSKAMTTEQARQCFAHLDSTRTEQVRRMRAAWLLAISIGPRRGELLGLTWDRLDLDSTSPTIHIDRTLKIVRNDSTGTYETIIDLTKTARSDRTLNLPTNIAAALIIHRAEQKVEKAAAAHWPDRPLDHDLVFRNPSGGSVVPDTFRKLTATMTKAAGLGHWSPRDLRHSAGSIMLANGVPLYVVSEVLGHASISITKDVYGHLERSAYTHAADTMTKALS